MTFKTWFFNNSDKLLLMFMAVFYTLVALHIWHDMADKEIIAWVTGLVSGFVSALGILINGNRNSNHTEKDDKDSK